MSNVTEIVAAAKAAGATVVTDVKVTGVSIYPAKSENVDFWVTLSINKPVDGMIAKTEIDGTKTFEKGKTKTITVPMGTVMTLLFDYLCEQEDDVSLDLVDYKKLIQQEAKDAAIAPEGSIVISNLQKLINLSTINVIARDVEHGSKVKSLFSINEKELDVINDSVWHDLYGLANVRKNKIAEALIWCKSANSKVAENATKASAFDQLMSSLKANNSQDAIAAALA